MCTESGENTRVGEYVSKSIYLAIQDSVIGIGVIVNEYIGIQGYKIHLMSWANMN